MNSVVWGGSLAGLAIGLFLALGSAFVIKKTMNLMDAPDESWSIGQATALGTIWISKLLAACFAIYYAQKMGLSTLYLGLGIPVGILVGVFIVKGATKDNK